MVSRPSSVRPRRRPSFLAAVQWFGLVLLTLTVLSGCSEGDGNREAAQEPPFNVVFISIDSLRADHLQSYGYPRATSPNLDKLANEGTLFENVIAESSWTLPSHISMFTGLSSYVHRVESDNVQLDESVLRLASRLKQAGYRTKGIYSGPYLDPLFGFGVGFDEYEAVGAERANVKGADDRSHRTVTSPEITDKAIEFVGREEDKPFFLFLHYFDVHYDYNPPEALWRKFDPDYQGNLSAENFMRNPAIHPKMNRRDLLHLLALYDAEILFTDQHIGRFLEALESNGLNDRTLVVVTSDHGDEFFEHGGKGHRRTLFDELLKVPLLIRMPGRVPAGLRVSSQVRHIDLMPTILSLLGLPLKTPVSGTSVTGMLERSKGMPESSKGMLEGSKGMLEGSKQKPGLTAVFRSVNHGTVWVTVRTSDRKYLVSYGDERRSELLCDLASDPRELKPIASRVVAFSRGEGPIELDGFMDALTRFQSKEATLREAHGGATSENIDLPDDDVERLRSLGYIQ